MTPQEAILNECAEAKQTLTESLINRIWRNNSTLIYSGSTEARIILDALEKQIPQKPIKIGKSISVMYGDCPVCGHRINNYDDRNGCSECLQAIDWSDTE